MTDTNHLSFSASETKVLTRLLEAPDTVAKADLMAGITDSDNSFKVLLSRLRGKGFKLDRPSGQGVKAFYSLTDDEKRTLRSLGF